MLDDQLDVYTCQVKVNDKSWTTTNRAQVISQNYGKTESSSWVVTSADQRRVNCIVNRECKLTTIFCGRSV